MVLPGADRLLILAPEPAAAVWARAAVAEGLPPAHVVGSLAACLDGIGAGMPVALLWWVDPTTLGGSSDLCSALARVRAVAPELPLLLRLESRDPAERVAALDGGADDVIGAACDSRELWARLRVWQRRAQLAAAEGAGDLLRYRDLQVGLTNRTAARGGEPLKLTVKEFDLLLYLLRHKQRVLPRLTILKAVWGETWVGDDNLLDVYIRYLRKKIERPDLEPLIHTVRGVGFVLK